MFDRLKIDTREKAVAVVFLLIIFSILAGIFFHPVQIGVEFRDTYRANSADDANLVDAANSVFDALETSVGAGVPLRTGFIEMYGLAQLLMGKNIVIDPNYGALYKTPYGQIAHAAEDVYTDKYLDNMYGLVNSLVSNKIPFLYVQAPFKLPDSPPQLPPTVIDYSNANADRFINSLTAANIDCFDLRPLIFGSGASQNELFFDTDHHWTIETAFFAAGRIVDKLNSDYGFQIDETLYDTDSYHLEKFENFYAGTMGRRVGRLYGGIDDFTLMTPRFETLFSLLEDGETLYEGSFEDVIVRREYLDLKAPFGANLYAAYRGDNAELIFTNHLVDKGKILLIKDSFGVPVYSFLAPGLHEVRAIDLRLFKGNVAEYIIECGPDIVILLYNADCFRDQMFEFGGL